MWRSTSRRDEAVDSQPPRHLHRRARPPSPAWSFCERSLAAWRTARPRAWRARINNQPESSLGRGRRIPGSSRILSWRSDRIRRETGTLRARVDRAVEFDRDKQRRFAAAAAGGSRRAWPGPARRPPSRGDPRRLSRQNLLPPRPRVGKRGSRLHDLVPRPQGRRLAGRNRGRGPRRLPQPGSRRLRRRRSLAGPRRGANRSRPPRSTSSTPSDGPISGSLNRFISSASLSMDQSMGRGLGERRVSPEGPRLGRDAGLAG